MCKDRWDLKMRQYPHGKYWEVQKMESWVRGESSLAYER